MISADANAVGCHQRRRSGGLLKRRAGRASAARRNVQQGGSQAGSNVATPGYRTTPREGCTYTNLSAVRHITLMRAKTGLRPEREFAGCDGLKLCSVVEHSSQTVKQFLPGKGLWKQSEAS